VPSPSPSQQHLSRRHPARGPSPAAAPRGCHLPGFQDGSESSGTGSIVKYVTSSFSTAEDIFALAGIGFAAVAALWASVNLIEIIDKLPVLPLLFELVGILVAWLFIYNNLLFKPKRKEFLENIKSSGSRILGQ